MIQEQQNEKCFICHDELEAGQTCATVHTGCLAICNHGEKDLARERVSTSFVDSRTPEEPTFYITTAIIENLKSMNNGTIYNPQKETELDNIRDGWINMKIKQEAREELKKELLGKLPEQDIKWMQEGSHKDRKGFTDGFNSCLAEIKKLLE